MEVVRGFFFPEIKETEGIKLKGHLRLTRRLKGIEDTSNTHTRLYVAMGNYIHRQSYLALYTNFLYEDPFLKRTLCATEVSCRLHTILDR